MPLSDDLRTALAGLAGQHPLLIALDFDGVLTPLVDDPSQSRPLPDSVDALAELLEAGVHVAFVSGRDLDGLRAVAGADPRVQLVGSHGAQWDLPSHTLDLSDREQELLDTVHHQLDTIVAEHPGTRLELKPTSGVLHTRLADASVGRSATAAAMSGPATLPGVHVTPGKNVLEIAVTAASKGAALSQLRREMDASAVLFAGDDVTDETAFQTLTEGDVGIKVGAGHSCARYRVADPAEIAEVLTTLAVLLRSPH